MVVAHDCKTGRLAPRTCLNKELAKQPSARAASAIPILYMDLEQLEAVRALAPFQISDRLPVEEDDTRSLELGYATKVVEEGGFIPCIKLRQQRSHRVEVELLGKVDVVARRRAKFNLRGSSSGHATPLEARRAAEGNSVDRINDLELEASPLL